VTDRSGLVTRVGQIRRLASARGVTPDRADDFQTERVRTLERRVAHLERMVEGFQDSVHRESDRHAKLIAELQEQIHPAQLGPALAQDARHRGL